MVIQRIQSVYLLVCAILMAVLSLFVSIGSAPVADGGVLIMKMIDFLPLFVLNLIVAVIFIVDIFAFKDLPLQMKVIRIGVVLTIVSLLIFAFYFVFQKPVGVDTAVILPIILYLATVVFAFLALSGCKRDHKILTSYDRLR